MKADPRPVYGQRIEKALIRPQLKEIAKKTDLKRLELLDYRTLAKEKLLE